MTTISVTPELDLGDQELEENPLLKDKDNNETSEKAQEEFARHRKIAIECCDTGRKFLNNKDYENACKEFSKTVMTFEFILKNNMGQKFMKNQIALLLKEFILPAYSNLSLCYLKMEKYSMVLTCSNQVLANDPSNVKNLFRRGIAHKMSKAYEQAIHDLEMVKKLDPSMIQECNPLIADAKVLQKKLKEKQKNTAKKFIEGYSSDIITQEENLTEKLLKPDSFFEKIKKKIKDSCEKFKSIFSKKTSKH